MAFGLTVANKNSIQQLNSDQYPFIITARGLCYTKNTSTLGDLYTSFPKCRRLFFSPLNFGYYTVGGGTSIPGFAAAKNRLYTSYRYFNLQSSVGMAVTSAGDYQISSYYGSSGVPWASLANLGANDGTFRDIQNYYIAVDTADNRPTPSNVLTEGTTGVSRTIPSATPYNTGYGLNIFNAAQNIIYSSNWELASVVDVIKINSAGIFIYVFPPSLKRRYVEVTLPAYLVTVYLVDNNTLFVRGYTNIDIAIMVIESNL